MFGASVLLGSAADAKFMPQVCIRMPHSCVCVCRYVRASLHHLEVRWRSRLFTRVRGSTPSTSPGGVQRALALLVWDTVCDAGFCG